MKVFGFFVLLLLPYVLHDEFDNDCIEDGTRERCSKFLLIDRVVDITGIFNGRLRHWHQLARPQAFHSENQQVGRAQLRSVVVVQFSLCFHRIASSLVDGPKGSLSA